MKLTYLGHSGFIAESGGYRVALDPFLTGNELAVIGPDDLEVDAVVLTHAHSDHLGDTVPIAKKNDCIVVANYELAQYLALEGLRTVGMNIGGSMAFDWGRVKFTPALHSSGIGLPDGTMLYGGEAGGVLLTMGDKTFYHVGDTALYGELKLVGELNRGTLAAAAVPIGDVFTMGPDDALVAAEWIGAGLAIPVHFDTFPPIRQDAGQWVERLREKGLKGTVLSAGESLEI